MARLNGYNMTNRKQVAAARKLAKTRTYSEVAKALKLSSAKAAWCLVNNDIRKAA